MDGGVEHVWPSLKRVGVTAGPVQPLDQQNGLAGLGEKRCCGEPTEAAPDDDAVVGVPPRAARISRFRIALLPSHDAMLRTATPNAPPSTPCDSPFG